MIPWLETEDPFPPVVQALRDPDGLLAAGADLSPTRLLCAYQQGIFPWFNPGEPILWWSPDPRCVLFPDQLHVSSSLRKRLRKADYQVCFDSAFTQVMHACAEPRAGQPGTWISQEMVASYTRLHQQGIAHSVEVWQDKELIGGLYGLALGRCFFGESMFSRRRDASKIALTWLCSQLSRWEFELIDCQVHNGHLASLGATMISRTTFRDLLARHAQPIEPGRWTLSIDLAAVMEDCR